MPCVQTYSLQSCHYRLQEAPVWCFFEALERRSGMGMRATTQVEDSFSNFSEQGKGLCKPCLSLQPVRSHYRRIVRFYLSSIEIYVLCVLFHTLQSCKMRTTCSMHVQVNAAQGRTVWHKTQILFCIHSKIGFQQYPRLSCLEQHGPVACTLQILVLNCVIIRIY